MVDKVSEFRVAFSGDASDLDSVLSAIKGKFRTAVSDIEATTKKVNVFADLEAKTKASSEALFDASTKAKLLAADLEKVKAAGGTATKELTDNLKLANAEVTKTTAAFNRNVDALTKMENALTKAGVDTSNLARAQLKLAEASKVATAAAEQQAAKQLLGVKTLQDIAPQIQKLNAAYDTLRASGTLSAKEIASAQTLLQAKLKETNATVSTVGAGLKGAGTEISTFFSTVSTRVLGVAAVVGTLTAVIGSAIAANKEYAQSVAEIGTVTNLTRAQLDALGSGARQLAQTVGFDLTQGMKALFEIIRSGVPPENALEVLKISAEAAKASLTDIGTAAKVSAVLLDGFGLEVGDLRGAFDALVQGSKDGGATLKEFSESAGPLLNVARSLRVPFNDLVAVLTVMTDASNDAAGSAAALTKILIKLGDPEVKGKLRELGITSTNVLDIFKQLGDKGIPLQQFIDLGIASTKTAAGIAALTNNAGKLAPELDRIAKSAGAVDQNLKALYDSPAERSARFNAALKETEVSFGAIFGSGSKVQDIATQILTSFQSVVLMVPQLDAAAQALANTTANMDGADRLLQRIAADAKATGEAIASANARIAASSDSLLTSIKALQDAANRDVADINARADAQIAALNRSNEAQAATAKATIAIQTKLAADRLAIIQKNERDILAAVELATKAQNKSASETAQIRIAALQPILAQYQAHYNALIGLAQQHLAKIQSIEQERISFNEGVEKTLFDIRLGGLSALDQYAAKVKEIDRLISEARQAGVQGDIASAKKYTDQAIALSGTLKEVINKDGVVVVSAFEAQAKAIAEIKKASDGYNASLDQADTLAKQGFDATKQGIDEVVPKLTELQKRYDDLKASIAEGLELKVKFDEASVASALSLLAELSRDRDVTIRINTVQGNAAGGFIGGMAQRFAGGGFARPSWSKVPGVGSGDTVPAALQAGSFVVRKAASQYYGDRLMSRLARGYAGGGFVDFDKLLGLFGGRNPFGIRLPQTSGSHANTAQTAFMIDPKRGFQSGDSFQNNDPPLQFTPRAIPQALINARNVIEYAREMLHLVGETNPILGSLGQTIKALLKRLDLDPFDQDAIGDLLQQAQTIGANPFLFSMWGKTQGTKGKLTPTWFIDWLGKNRAGDLARAAKGFAAGGGTTDTVPAMLTPGEFVINRSAASRLGADWLHAINSMAVPKAALSHMLNFAPPRPHSGAVARFADGGPVGSVPRAGSAGASSKVGDVHFNIYAQSVDEKTVRRDVVPLITKILARSR